MEKVMWFEVSTGSGISFGAMQSTLAAWTNNHLVQFRVFASPGLNVLTQGRSYAPVYEYMKGFR